MRQVWSALLRPILLAVALFGPMIVGIPLDTGGRIPTLAWGVALGSLLGALWVLGGYSSEWARKVTYVVVSCFLALTLVNVLARPPLLPLVSPGFSPKWPPMPLVRRHIPNVRWRGTIYGESADAWSMAKYREHRVMRYAADRFGFRNDRTPDGPLDIIVIGDSFAAGVDTTQDQTWSVILAKRQGLHVYNMAIGGDGPWAEWANLTLEIDRLPRRPQGTVVLWMLFTGNDLVDPCYPIFSKEQLPWRHGLARLMSSFSSFRSQSPLGMILARFAEQSAPADNERAKKFLDGSYILFSPDYAQQAALNLDAVRSFPNYACLRQTVSAMRRLAESKGLTVAVIVAPPKDEVYSWVRLGLRPWSTPPNPSGFALAMRELAQENHMPFLDLKPLLIEVSKRVYQESGRLIWWRDDTHWNEEGNREVAKIVAQFYTSVTGPAPLP